MSILYSQTKPNTHMHIHAREIKVQRALSLLAKFSLAYTYTANIRAHENNYGCVCVLAITPLSVYIIYWFVDTDEKESREEEEEAQEKSHQMASPLFFFL